MNEERLSKLRILIDDVTFTDEEKAELDEVFAAARERNELEAELTEEREACKKEHDYAEQLRANNAALREAVGAAIRGLPELLERNALIDEENMIGELQEALASTPADSLTEYRNGVLREDISEDDMLYLKRCADNLREFMTLFEEGPTLSTEILADNLNYFDCFIDKIEKRRAMKTNRLDTMTDEEIIQDVRDNNDTN